MRCQMLANIFQVKIKRKGVGPVAFRRLGVEFRTLRRLRPLKGSIKNKPMRMKLMRCVLNEVDCIYLNEGSLLMNVEYVLCIDNNVEYRSRERGI